jgi:MoxR-like ATPase
MMEQQVNTETALQNIQRLTDNIETVIKGKRNQIKFVLTALLAKGHILMEDNPGTGKTVMAKTLAQSISGSHDQSVNFKRIQFTPDLLPMDLIGSHIFDDVKKEFIFKKGPLFCNVLLADEINRASPKVQSALLECMAETQITMGEITYKLDKLFFTIATQNPVEMEGTYPLPAAQLDRFFIKIIFGYVDEETELNIYKDYLGINNNLNNIQQVLGIDEILFLQEQSENVFVHEELIRAVRNIVWATRRHQDIMLGASTRSGITFLKCLKAYALVNGRTYVIEDDINDLCQPVLDHRLIYRNKEAKANALIKIE